MPRYHRSGPAHVGPTSVRKRRSSKKRFSRTSIAVLDPRKLFSPKQTPTPRTRRKAPRQSLLRRLYASRDWHFSHALALVLLVAALFATGYGFLSNDFWVYSAIVSNNRHTSSEEIYREAGIDNFSVFFIDPRQVVERLKQLPHVQDARVQVRLPAQVRIQVKEREPIILYQIQGDSHWIDAEGVIMSAVEDRTDLVKLI
ncbi:MAG TPA: FtsQ-type POTRA domain-containing protein, partial [Caldilineae bacterium]|nr:FtsQ-type POTRA domain-containing protein [Caldilineae bacterium]